MLYQTVTLASEMLHISQPATTRLLADLERSLKFTLFDRVKGRLYPTVEAQALYEEVQRSLVGVDRIARAADEIRNLRRGTLLVAGAPAIKPAQLSTASSRCGETAVTGARAMTSARVMGDSYHYARLLSHPVV